MSRAAYLIASAVGHEVVRPLGREQESEPNTISYYTILHQLRLYLAVGVDGMLGPRGYTRPRAPAPSPLTRRAFDVVQHNAQAQSQNMDQSSKIKTEKKKKRVPRDQQKFQIWGRRIFPNLAKLTQQSFVLKENCRCRCKGRIFHWTNNARRRCWAVSTCESVDAGVASDGIILDPNSTLPCGLNLEGTCEWPNAILSLDCAEQAQIVLWSRLTASHPHRCGVAGDYGDLNHTKYQVCGGCPRKTRSRKFKVVLEKDIGPAFEGRSIPVYPPVGIDRSGGYF